jgi:hypothetical protein
LHDDGERVPGVRVTPFYLRDGGRVNRIAYGLVPDRKVMVDMDGHEIKQHRFSLISRGGILEGLRYEDPSIIRTVLRLHEAGNLPPGVAVREVTLRLDGNLEGTHLLTGDKYPVRTRLWSIEFPKGTFLSRKKKYGNVMIVDSEGKRIP